MVVTRSQGDAAEMEEQRRQEQLRREEREARHRELERVELERIRRHSLDPPRSPSTRPGGIEDQPSTSGITLMPTVTADPSSELPTIEDRRRAVSPVRTIGSQRSTTSINTRLRLAELEAAERLAAIRKKELEMEADLVKKRLEVQVSALQDDQDSLHENPLIRDDHQRVDDWLHSSAVNSRGERPHINEPRRLRFDVPRGRSPTPTRSRGRIEQLADALEKMARPRTRQADLPTFSGAVNEWLPFKAAMQDSTKIYQVSPIENLQRLRSCLKGEARDAVAALLHTATDPEIIMKTLEQCFGRPEVIIDKALEDLKRMPRPGTSATELNTFAVKLQNTVCVLKTIDKRGYLYNPLLAREVLDKLSPHVRSRWCDYASDFEGTSDPEIVVLSRFLMREANRALKYSYVSASSTASSTITRRETRPAAVNPRRKPNIVYATEAEEQPEPCPSCGQAHTLLRCANYKALAVDQRWDLVRDKKLCFKCIQKKHRRSSCKAKSCGVNECRRPHHATLHHEEKIEIATETAKPEAVLSVASIPNGSKTVLLKICPVVVVGPRGEANTYALLDEGATITLIDEDLARRVGAEGTQQPLRLHGVNMFQNEEDSKLVEIRLRGKKQDTLHKVRARTIKNLKLHQQSVPGTLMKSKHLQDLHDICYDTAQPGILVGTDHWECIVSRELRIGGPDQPAASRTQLGWVVHGTVPRRLIMNNDSVLHVCEPERQHDQELHTLVEEHFKIEALTISRQPRVSENNRRAMNIVEKTIKKINNGYEVGLPWRRDNIALPPSFDMAFRRLKKIEQKMDKSPEFAAEYTTQIENLLKKGYAVQCDGSERASNVCWYLPHFAVQNPNKPGKQRLVFDAAAMSHGVSLNDHLLEGPDMLRPLPGIIFRFREKAIAITADIQEMFLRVKIRPEDQAAQQFLWRGEDRQNPPQHFKMTSMIFGAASSPFMAHYVRDYNAKMHAREYPKALEVITHNHYVDDLVASYDSKEEAINAIEETRIVHAVAGFTLRGWSANYESVLHNIPPGLRATSPTQLGGEQPANKILGLYWNHEQDELGFNTSMNRVPAAVQTHERAPTKREALSAVMSIYDPLGLLSQYTIRAKIILQSLWRLKTSWDEPIPQEEDELFASWLSQLQEIAQLRLNRSYTPSRCDHIELHIMCDASEQAYAAVAYWRYTNDDGIVGVSLVAAKSKVAPRRTQTIPRLELQAAVIGARLADYVRKEHRFEIRRTVYWTDSSTVVHWIRHDQRRYTPFVAHRLGEISELTQKNEWRWLPTQYNVADDATRFSQAPISTKDRWFRGPSFLYTPEEQWPAEQTTEENEQEVLHTTKEDTEGSWLPDPARFSKYETLLRATARALAFVDMCRRRATRLECRHLERAERELIHRAQRESFGEDRLKIESGRPISRTSRLFKLDPILDGGLLKVRGRIEAASAPLETKRPIILDGRHHLTKLIVLREHCRAGHANRERVINDLRQRYWVIHLRPTVRAIERDCVLCRVRQGKRRPVRIGDVVIIADSTLPRNTWPMGIVEKTYPGPDGGVRVVDVKTTTGIFKRPVSRLVVVNEEATQAAPGGGC